MSSASSGEGRPAGALRAPGRRGGVWQLAWPTMTTFFLQSLVGFVDMVFVAQLGTETVAGVGIGSQVHFIAFALETAVTTGTVALVSRSWGAGNTHEADRVVQASLILGAGMGAVLLIVVPFTEDLIALFGVGPEVVQVGGSYLRILILGTIPLNMAIVVASAMRGAGDVRTPLAIGIGMNAINVVLDYALIFGHFGAPALGADGSAIATVISFVLGGAIYVGLWAGNMLVIPFERVLDGIPTSLFRRILRVGIPSALEQVAFNIGLFLFLRLVSEFGTEPVSAYLIGVRILSFSFVPGMGFSMAASTLVGQHLGATEPDEAARAGWRATAGAVAVMTSLGLIIISLARPISEWFGAAGEVTVGLTVTFIYILGAAQPLMAIEFAIGGGLRGAGDTRFPLLSLLIGLFVFRLGGASIVYFVLGGSVAAVWSCLLADYAVKALLLSGRFRRGRWKEIEV